MRRAPGTPEVTLPPTRFEVGAHSLLVAKVQEGRWTVAIDGRPLDASFGTQADAWQAGVREAQRVDDQRAR